MKMQFELENEIKQEFLKTYPTDTAKTSYFVMRLADEYEQMIGKSVYNMSYKELYDMFSTQYRNSSTITVSKNVSIIKKYIDYCIEKNVVNHGENRVATFTIDDVKSFVNKDAMRKKYINKTQLREYENMLINAQDVAVLRLPFMGVKGVTLKDVINLRMSDVDAENNTVFITSDGDKMREVRVDGETIGIIEDAYDQELYIENNGEETSNSRIGKNREIFINQVEDFVFRVPGKNKFKQFTPAVLRSRYVKIQKFIGNMYITPDSLFMSGLIENAKRLEKEKGVLEKEDYAYLGNKFAYMSQDGVKYWHTIKSNYEKYKELTEA